MIAQYPHFTTSSAATAICVSAARHDVDELAARSRHAACAAAARRGLLPSDPQVVQRLSMAHAAGYFHLHLVSDATGETLITVARAAAAQYIKVIAGRAHASAGAHAEAARPGAGRNRGMRRASCSIRCSRTNLVAAAGEKCRELGLPCLSILGPVLRLFQSYLGAETDATGRRPARAQCRIFQAHRCAELHDAA